MQRHALDKGIQRTRRHRVKPLLKGTLADLHPVLHHFFQRRFTVHQGIQLIHQLHIMRGGDFRAVDQRSDRFAGHFRPGDTGKKLAVLLRHRLGKSRKRLFEQRVYPVEIVGHRAQRHARTGGDFTVRHGVDPMLGNRLQGGLKDPLPPLRIVWSSAHIFPFRFVYKCTQTC